MPITGPLPSRDTHPLPATPGATAGNTAPPEADAASPALSFPVPPPPETAGGPLLPLRSSSGALGSLPSALLQNVEGFLELGEQEGLARTSATLSQTLRANARDPLLRELYAAQAEFREASQARSGALDPSRPPDDPVAALRAADAATLQRRAAGYRVEKATTQVASSVENQRIQRKKVERGRHITALCKSMLEGKTRNAAYDNQLAGELMFALGRPDAAVELAGRCGIHSFNSALLRAGRPKELITSDAASTLRQHLAEAHLLMGNPKDALECLQQMGDKAPRHLVAIAQYMQGDKAASELTLGGMLNGSGRTSGMFGWYEHLANIALVYANHGNVIEAVRWLRPDRFTRTLDAHLVVQSPFVPKEVREHPEWRRHLRELFAAPDQLAQIQFEVPPPPPASVRLMSAATVRNAWNFR